MCVLFISYYFNIFSFHFYVNYDHSYLHHLNSKWKGFWVSYLVWFSRKSTFICGHSLYLNGCVINSPPRPPVFFLYCRFTLVLYYLFIHLICMCHRGISSVTWFLTLCWISASLLTFVYTAKSAWIITYGSVVLKHMF
jgi:hypothetical protein